jgi:hypothetical protein
VLANSLYDEESIEDRAINFGQHFRRSTETIACRMPQ